LAITGVKVKSEAMRRVSYLQLPQVNILSGLIWIHSQMKLEQLIVQDCPNIAETNLKTLLIKQKQWGCLDWVKYFDEATGTMDVSSLTIDLLDWPAMLEAWQGEAKLRRQVIKHLVALGKGFTPLAAKRLMEVCPELTTITITNYMIEESEIKIQSFIGHSTYVTCLALLSDGRVISGSKDCTLKIWNAETSVCEQTLTDHNTSINCLAIMQDGRILSGSDDAIKVWDPLTGLCEQTITEYSALLTAYTGARCLAVLRDGRLVSGTHHLGLKIWNLQDNTKQVIGQNPYIGQGVFIINCLVVLDDSRIVSVGSDNNLKIWDFRKNICEEITTGHTEMITCLAVLQENQVIIGSFGGDLEIRKLQNNICEYALKVDKGITYLSILYNGWIVCSDKYHLFLC
ncbi:MAG: hypothetical protein ACK4PR_11100, partial [Gammaproteobacteria bacterium]